MAGSRRFDQSDFKSFIPVFLFDAIRCRARHAQKFGNVQRPFAFIQQGKDLGPLDYPHGSFALIEKLIELYTLPGSKQCARGDMLLLSHTY